jgi:hypothetical protein
MSQICRIKVPMQQTMYVLQHRLTASAISDAPLPWLSRISSSSGFTGSRQEAVREHTASTRLRLFAQAVSASGNTWHRLVLTAKGDQTPLAFRPTSLERATLTLKKLPGLPWPVRDENLKKLLMSWYYAGYYTGLFEGQQQAQQQSQQKTEQSR